MCSIGGFFASDVLKPAVGLRLTRGLLYYGDTRGSQSSGVFSGSTLVKKAISPYEFINEKEFTNLLATPTKMVLTHTRQPTTGGRGDEQAHPFWVGNTVTVHNGWLTNCEEIRKKWEIDKPSGVDSELLASALHKYGIAKFPEVVKTMQGSASLGAWHEGKLYLARDSNPMEYMWIDVSNGHKEPIKLFIFASTEFHLQQAIAHQWLLKKERSTTLPEYKLFEVDLENEDIQEVGEFKTANRYSGYHGGGGRHTGYDGDFSVGGSTDSARYRPHAIGIHAHGMMSHRPQMQRNDLPTIDYRKDTEFINQLLKTMHPTEKVCLFGYHFTAADVKALIVDPTVIPPRDSKDWGMKTFYENGTTIRRLIPRYGAMQKIKFPSLTALGGGKGKKNRIRWAAAATAKGPVEGATETP